MSTQDTNTIPEYYFLNEVAQRLRVSVKTVRREISRGKIFSFPVGGKRCILVSEVQDYLQRQIAKGKGNPPC